MGAKRTLHLMYDLVTHTILGDATGKEGEVITVRGGGDSARCELSLKIEGTSSS